MKIVYKDQNDAVEFDMDRFLKSLNKYGQVTKDQVLRELENYQYDPLHVSCLVEIGTKLVGDRAKEYFDDHKREGMNFERLRRITGYLVGSLERWNDGKKAEEKARVKHSLAGMDKYSPEEKTAIEVIKLENSVMSQF